MVILGPLLAFGTCALLVAGCGSGERKAQAEIGRPIQVATAPNVLRQPASRSAVVAPPRLAESEPVASHRGLGAAREAALRFFPAYVQFVYGRIAAGDVPDLSRRLRGELRKGTGLVTPAEKAAKPRILDVKVKPAGPPVSVIASADVAAGRGRYTLTATLEPQHGGWVVVAADG